eukprot:444294-Prorocentrum_minimum.AAC.2
MHTTWLQALCAGVRKAGVKRTHASPVSARKRRGYLRLKGFPRADREKTVTCETCVGSPGYPDPCRKCSKLMLLLTHARTHAYIYGSLERFCLGNPANMSMADMCQLTYDVTTCPKLYPNYNAQEPRPSPVCDKLSNWTDNLHWMTVQRH